MEEIKTYFLAFSFFVFVSFSNLHSEIALSMYDIAGLFFALFFFFSGGFGFANLGWNCYVC